MKVKFFISAVMLLVATSASAQFQPSGSSNTLSSDDVSGYNSLYFQFNPQTMKIDAKDADDVSGYKGIALGWKKGISLMQSHPLFLEAGLAFQYTFRSDEESEYNDDYEYGWSTETKTNMGTLSVPLNLTYRFAIPNSTVSIAPYAGLTLKGNLWAKSTTTTTTEYSGDKDTEKTEINLFDKKDVGDNNTAKRLQVAWQIGVNVNIKTFYLGVGYGSDLSDFQKKCKFSTTYLTLGFNL